jgi:hypothetical protein
VDDQDVPPHRLDDRGRYLVHVAGPTASERSTRERDGIHRRFLLD